MPKQISKHTSQHTGKKQNSPKTGNPKIPISKSILSKATTPQCINTLPTNEFINWKSGALLAPVPAVMVTCGTLENPNIITIAWTGIVNTIPPMTYISIRPTRHSYDIIKKSGEFVINLTTAELCRSCDLCGVKSGEHFDKLKATGLTVQASSSVKAPFLSQSPLSLECKVVKVEPLGSHDMFLAEILSINVNKKLIDKNGKLHLDQAELLAYAHGEYFQVGKKLGSFGFSVRKK